MSTAIYPFDLLQIGKESTKGTLVAATKQLICDGKFTEEQDFYRSNYPRSVRATRGGAGVLTRKGMLLDIVGDLTYEEALWPLSSGIRGSISPSVANTTENTWLFTPQLTGYPTLDSATVEVVRADGATNHYYGEFGYGLTSGFKIDFAFNQVAKIDWKMFGRARQTDTVTGSLSPYTGREEVVTNLLKVFADTTWAGLGGTQLSTIVRSASLDVTTGIMPDYTMDGRSDLDMTIHKVGALAAKLTLVLEFDTNGLAQSFTKFRANSQTYIRLVATGSTISVNPKKFQVDGSYRFTTPPSIAPDGDQNLVTCELEAVYDTTGTKMLEFTVVNALTSL